MVPAFVGGASNHLGYVTGLAGLPVAWPQIAGGVLNTINGMSFSLRKLLRQPSTSIDTSGPYGLSPQNYANIAQGFSDGLAASQPPAPFNDYGYGPQTQPAADQIGDGNGIAAWTPSMAGIDPQEPTPPAWPPEVDTPIRYLGRLTQ